jgi:hypothetical protein
MLPHALIDDLRRVDLRGVLRAAGAIADRYDKNKWHTSQGVISVSGQKFMNWNRSCGGGGAIDLVIHLQQCDFKSAVSWLSTNFPVVTPAPDAFHQRLLHLPERDDAKLDRIIRYLTVTRAIARSLVYLLIDSGTLYGDSKANAVFLLLGKEKTVVGAEMRGTTLIPWRGMAPGSRKDLGYFSIAPAPTRAVVLCESAIDAVSCAELYPNCMGISTSGANPDPAWVKSLIVESNSISCGFDADHTGDRLADKMMQIHPTVARLRPPRKDWNDVLKAVKSLVCSKGQSI